MFDVPLKKKQKRKTRGKILLKGMLLKDKNEEKKNRK